MDYRKKYIKYKNKYFQLKNQMGGNSEKIYPTHDEGKTNDDKVRQHLALFEMMNYEGYNKRNWDLVRAVFDQNIVTTFSNGTQLKGIEENMYMLMLQNLEWSPDQQIRNKIQFGSGDWTALNMVIYGTFTKPMKHMTGQTIQPTNKKYSIENCIFGYWANNKLVEMFVFGDQSAFMKELGIDPCVLPNKQTGGQSYPTFDSGNGDETVKRHLGLLERENFEGFNKRNWDLVRQLYDENVILKMANGPEFKGIDAVLANMQDGLDETTKVDSINIHFGSDRSTRSTCDLATRSGDWTAVSMTMSGTFSQAVENPKDGSTIKPTNKPWRMNHAALIRWRNDKIIEIIGFWDNGEFMKQIGLSQC